MLSATLLLVLSAQDPMQVVATIPDLADLAQIFAGEQVEVTTLVPAGADPHAILPRASLLLKLQRAELLLCMGLDYEHAFLPALLEKSRNDEIRPGGKGWFCAADHITALEVPDALDRGQGADLHPRGNPHFNLDPIRMRAVATSLCATLVGLRPERRELIESRWRAWDADLAKRQEQWALRLAPLRGAKIVTYHRSWTYFADRYGLVLGGEVEPKPGLPPTASHLLALKQTLQAESVRVLLMEPWYSERSLGRLLEGTSTRLVKSATTCGLTSDTAHYLDFLGALVEEIALAHGLKESDSP